MPQETKILVDKVLCLHPRHIAENARRTGSPTQFIGRCNSYVNSAGRAPGVAWVLVNSSDASKLGANDYHKMTWKSGSTVLNTSTMFSIKKSVGISKAITGGSNYVKMLELHDVRSVLEMSSMDDQYNVRIPAPSTTSGTGLYYTDSLNGGSAWTWQTLLSDIWGNLPSIAGTAPTLPYTPDGTPENWRFIGVSAWDALHQVLEKLYCTTVLNPITGVFSYVSLGDSDAALNRVMSANESRLIYDYQPDSGLNQGNLPATVRVWFKRRELYHGAEKDTPDSDNWEMSPTVSKDYTVTATGAVSGTVVNVWDDLPATYNVSGTNTNSAALQTRADEIGAKWEQERTLNASGMRKRYSGVIAFTPGSLVQQVTLRDFGDDTGLITEIRRFVPEDSNDLMLKAPELEANYPPLYPRLSQPVQVNDGVSSLGTLISANASGLFPGSLLRFTGTNYTALDDIWLRPTDLDSGGIDVVTDVKQADRFIGRLVGSFTHSGDTRPTYLFRNGGSGTAGSWTLSADNGTSATILSGDTVDINASDRAFSEAGATQDDRGIVVQVAAGSPDVLDISTDNTVAQHVELTGSWTGAGTVDVEDGTVKTITFDATGGNLPPIDMTVSAGDITITPRNPFHVIDADSGASQDLDYGDELTITNSCWPTTVSKAASDVQVTLDGPPVGTILMNYQAPILDTGKYYMDDGSGSANTCWALMDGSSNASPGSGIKMCDTSDGATFIPRGMNNEGGGALDDAGNTARGRTALNPHDDDEVEISVEDHDDHTHTLSTDSCDNDTAGTDTEEYQFATQHPNVGGVKAIGGGAAGAGVLGHDLTGVNDQGDSPSGGELNIKMDPPTKLLWFFERVV